VPQARRLSADDDAIPDDADTFEISKAALKKRLERATRSQLKAAFGTDNVEEILQWKTQNEQFRQQEEQARLAQMSESERWKALHVKEAAQATHWKGEYEKLVESHAVREQDRQMTSIAQKYVHPKLMNAIMLEFASHLQGADEKEIGEPQAYADHWFKSYIEANPEFGAPQAAPPAFAPPTAPQMISSVNPNGTTPPGAPMGARPGMPTPFAPPPRQVPISNGAAGGRPQNAVPTGSLAQKTMTPGLPNSMTPDEVMRYKREHGYTW